MSLPAQHFYLNLRVKNKSGVNTSITDITIPRENIQYLTIREDILSILPRIEFVISDVASFVDRFVILDDDVISVIISQNEEIEPAIDMEFIISDYSFESDDSANHYNVVKFVGYAFSKNLFVPYRNRSFNDNSEGILSRIAKETGIKFDNPQRVNSSDKMIWYQDSNNFNFIKHILKRAYIPNDSIFFYSNTKNKFVYTSLRAEMKKEVNFNATFDEERVYNYLLMSDENDRMFFNSYNVVNLTGLFNKISNYAATFGFYNLRGEYIGGTVDRVDKMTDLYNKSKEYDGEPSIFCNVGLFGNNEVFEEFPRGIVQNMFLKYNLFSTTLLLNINSMTDVKLFDRVNVGIPEILDDKKSFNEPYSGNYLVGSITHNITYDGVYQKKVMLCRNGINKSDVLNDYNVN